MPKRKRLKREQLVIFKVRKNATEIEKLQDALKWIEQAQKALRKGGRIVLIDKKDLPTEH